MSGGSFDYLYSRELCDGSHGLSDMEDELRKLGYPVAADDTAICAPRAPSEALRTVWHAVEWFVSGDWSEADMRRIVAAYCAQQQPRTGRVEMGVSWENEDSPRLRVYVDGALAGSCGVKPDYAPALADHLRQRQRGAVEELEAEQPAWTEHNFGAEGKRRWEHPFLGVVEELGELSHAFLKQMQGIRGSAEEHEEAAKDAVGDLVVYLADLCASRGWELSAIIRKTWRAVRERDWVKYPQDGLTR